MYNLAKRVLSGSYIPSVHDKRLLIHCKLVPLYISLGFFCGFMFSHWWFN